MKLLHTSDWHIGKTLKGRNRLDEQRKVIGQIIDVAREHQPDAVLIAGDLYDVSAPSAEAQQLVVQALLALRDTGAEVIAIAGNHDSAADFRRLPAVDGRRRHHPGRVRPPRRERRRGVASTPARPVNGSMSPCCRSCPSAMPCGPPS